MLVDLYDPPNNLSGVKRDKGRYISAATVIRGKASTYTVESSISNTIKKNSSYFVEWVHDQVGISYCNVPYADY